METDLSPPAGKQLDASVASLWRYPVKSMMGEELNASEVTSRGLLGDRHFALRDPSDGKVVSAKNPKKWPNLFDFRAAFVDPPHSGSAIPVVRITLPDGTIMTTGQEGLSDRLSAVLGRRVTFDEVQDAEIWAGSAAGSQTARAEEYWPDIEELDYQDTVTDFDLPEGTFFDIAVVHLITTATIDHLHGLYPEGRFEVRRFRPNIVLTTGPGEQGFVEDGWIGHTLTIGDEVRLRITGPCPRCVMTTLPQGDLPKDRGILRTAAKHNDVNVGVYADVIRGGTIRRGDGVRLT